MQKQQITELQSKTSYYDLILQNKNTVPITRIAKDYGMSGRKFNELIHKLGVQCTNSERLGCYISIMLSADTHSLVPMQLTKAKV